MPESSNDQFSHNYHINHVIAPEAPTTSGGTPSSEETPDKKKMSLKNKFLIGGAGVALAAIAATGIGLSTAANGKKAPEAISSSAPANPSHTPEATPDATPSATPTTPETETGPVSYDYGLTQADVTPLLAESVATLDATPIEKRADLAMFYAQDLPQFAKTWQLISKNPGDVLPAKISADNTPQQAIAFISMAHRQAMTLRRSDLTFDKATSDKLLAASFISGSQSPVYNTLSEFGAQLDDGAPAPSARTLPASNYMQLPIVDKASDKYIDATGHTCIDMTVTQTFNGGVAPVTGGSTVCLVTNEHGSIWMIR